FRWTSIGGMTDLGTLKDNNSGNSTAFDTSADGSIVVGNSETNNSDRQAFIWTKKDGMIGLGTLRNDNSGSSTAEAITPDGKIIVGLAAYDSSYKFHA
ncbi:hypothetical protein WB60_13400, partial [bacteria symbiont BFo2 of Frankliniella occidentalis]